MSLQGLSLGKLAIILIIAGVVIVFAISGFQARDVFFAKHNRRNTSDNKRTGNLHSTS
jgi:hypothetical protein